MLLQATYIRPVLWDSLKLAIGAIAASLYVFLETHPKFIPFVPVLHPCVSERYLPCMSGEDVEALERIYAEWRRGRFTTSEIFDPEVEVVWSSRGLDTISTTKGLEALSARLQRWFDGFEDVRFEPEQYVDLGDQVLVVVLMRARGRSSGIEVVDRYGHLWTMRHGKAIRLEDADPETVA